MADAAPNPELDDQNAAALVNVRFFEDINWSGATPSANVEAQTQYFGIDGTGWSNCISSIQVPDGHRCRLWDSNSCKGDSSADIYAPGAKGLGGMNDKATSFKCYRN